MTGISGLALTTVEALLAQVHSAITPVYLANIKADNQVVIAGSDQAMGIVAEKARSQGAAKACRLAVSVPSHCPLLEVPARTMAQAFADEMGSASCRERGGQDVAYAVVAG